MNGASSQRTLPGNALAQRRAPTGLAPEAAPAIFITPKNSLAILGLEWRWVKRHAREWAVAVLRVDAKPLIRVEEFVAALEAHADPERAPAAVDDATELEAMRRQLGKRRRTSNPTVREEIAAESRAYRSPLPRRMPPERE